MMCNKNWLRGILTLTLIYLFSFYGIADAHHCTNLKEEKQFTNDCIAQGNTVAECEAMESSGEGHESGLSCDVPDSVSSPPDNNNGGGCNGCGGGSIPTKPKPKPKFKGFLENPENNSNQSGIGVISGWVCGIGSEQIKKIEFVIGDGTLYNIPTTLHIPYGGEREDTEDICKTKYNGFGLLFNWNLLGDGEHRVFVRVYLKNQRVSKILGGFKNIIVTTLGEEFVLDANEYTYTIEDHPFDGDKVDLRWSEALQNFVIIK